MKNIHPHPMSRRVLVADDDPLFCKLLQFTLEQMGLDWDIVTAGTGKETLEQLGVGAFDLLVLDLKMPDGDGYSVLQARSAGCPVVVVTHLSDDDHEHRCAELGAAGFLRKSRLRMADVIGAMQRHLQAA